jgi:hypothetical protein
LIKSFSMVFFFDLVPDFLSIFKNELMTRNGERHCPSSTYESKDPSRDNKSTLTPGFRPQTSGDTPALHRIHAAIV